MTNYVEYLSHTSVSETFAEVRDGFFTVLPKGIAGLFRPDELQLFLCGEAEIDLLQMKERAKVAGGFKASSPQVGWFWEVAGSMAYAERQAFLRFLFGFARVPLEGLKNVTMTLQRCGDDDSRLPVAHTCFGILDLPEYSSIEVLRERLLYAIAEGEGFGIA